jgi:hypothetical protein
MVAAERHGTTNLAKPAVEAANKAEAIYTGTAVTNGPYTWKDGTMDIAAYGAMERRSIGRKPKSMI